MSPIYKSKNGYIVKINYTDSKGNYKQICRCNKFTKTKLEAKEYEMKLLADIKDEHTSSNNITIGELFHHYINYVKYNIKPNTLRMTQSIYDNYIKQLQYKRIYDLSYKDLMKWKSYIDDQDLTISTKNQIYVKFNALLNYAVSFFGLKTNLLSKLKRFSDMSIVEDDKIKYWTYEEFKKFQYALMLECSFKKPSISIRWWSIYVLFNILFFCGLRRGEALALTWNDMIVKNGIYYFSITKSLNNQVKVEITKPKNKYSIREVPICNELSKILSEHRMRCESIVGFNISFYICGGLDAVSVKILYEIFYRFIKIADIQKIRIHDLRHSYISLLLNANLPLLSIARLVGHADIKMVQKVYAHIYPESDIHVIDILDKLGEN